MNLVNQILLKVIEEDTSLQPAEVHSQAAGLCSLFCYLLQPQGGEAPCSLSVFTGPRVWGGKVAGREACSADEVPKFS